MYDFQTPTYRRNQVEWVLWHVFLKRRNRPVDLPLPNRFLNRIKRFLELDEKLSGEEAQPAFFSDVQKGSGGARSFSLYDIFMLGLALDFNDAGYPQQDVVYLLQHTKLHFIDSFAQAMTYPEWKQGLRAPEEVPAAPKIKIKGSDYADPRMFFISQKNEIREVFDESMLSDLPIIMTVPMIFAGFASLIDFLEEDAAYREHHHFIVEFGRLAVELRDAVAKAPLIKRGRKAATIVEEVFK